MIKEEWLRNIQNSGVSGTHIEKMKNELLLHSSCFKYFYEKSDKDMYKEAVQLEKVVGINTGWKTANESIFDLFLSVTGEIQNIHITKQLKYKRIEENYLSLCENGLEYQYEFYASDKDEARLRDGLPKLIYYVDDDVYFSNATHRTVSAKFFNAPKLMGRVYEYRRNQEHFDNYNKICEKYDLWNKFINEELNNLKLVDYGKSDNYRNRAKGYYLYIKESDSRRLCHIPSPIFEWNKNICRKTNESEEFCKRIDYIINKIKEIDNQVINWKPSRFELFKLRGLNFICRILFELYYSHNFNNCGSVSDINESYYKISLKAKRNYIHHEFGLEDY